MSEQKNHIKPIVEYYKSEKMNIKKILLTLLIGACCVFCLYLLISNFFDGSSRELKKVNKSVSNIQLYVDSINQTQAFLASRILEIEARQIDFQEKIGENNRLLSKNAYELSIIKKMYNEKIRSIDYYNSSQLDSFFRSRYLSDSK